MRVVIFWAMCHHSLGHEKKALLTIAHVLFKNTKPKVVNYYSSYFYPVTSIASAYWQKNPWPFILHTCYKKEKNKKQKQIGQSPDSLFVAFFPFFFVSRGQSWKIKTCKEHI